MKFSSVCKSQLLEGATWVWTAGNGRRNQYLALRLVKEGVDLENLFDNVPVCVSAGSLYRLYVNGHYLGRGPVREWAGHAGLDSYELRPLLKPGRNVISVLVHYFGEKVGGYPLSPPGFLLAGTLGAMSLSTGSAPWQVAELDAWDEKSERISLYNGFNEWVDLEFWNPQVWEQGDDATEWQVAIPVPEVARVHPCLESRMIPPLAENVLSPMIQCECDGNGMLFDAGRMLSGSIEVELTADTTLELEIHYGDRLEDGVFVGDHGGANRSVDRLRVPIGRRRYEGAFALRGFRYVRLSWKSAAPREIVIIPREIVYPTTPHAVFETGDPWLKRCWKTAHLTVRLCMADTYMDNPSRERQQYGGDGYIQSLYGYELFRDTALWRQFLRHYAQGRREDGAIQSGGPWCWNQIIPAWTLLWIESIREYYRHTRDISIAKEYVDAVEGALAWFVPMEGADGLLTVDECFHWEGGNVLWNFIDWQNEKDQLKGAPARLALNGFYALGLDAASELSALAGCHDLATLYDAKRRKLSNHLAGISAMSEHALVTATLAGAVKDRMGEVAIRIREGRSETDVMFVFFTLKALLQEGYSDAAMTLIRDIFDPMMRKKGHTTFWETRHVPPGSSRAVCQAIGGAPAYWLPRLVAGIRDIDAVGRTIVLGPPLPGIRSARVRLPCVDGYIEICVRDGLGCDPRLPEDWNVVHVDDQKVDPTGARQKSGKQAPSQSEKSYD